MSATLDDNIQYSNSKPSSEIKTVPKGNAYGTTSASESESVSSGGT